jgi:hypothetical protein
MNGVEVPSLKALEGQLIPDVDLESASGRPLDFVAHVRLFVYLFPGTAGIAHTWAEIDQL